MLPVAGREYSDVMATPAPTVELKPPVARRWLQFRLRTLLLLTLAVACGLAWWQANRGRLDAIGPIDWEIKLDRRTDAPTKRRNIRWLMPLGTHTAASPVVA